MSFTDPKDVDLTGQNAVDDPVRTKDELSDGFLGELRDNATNP